MQNRDGNSSFSNGISRIKWYISKWIRHAAMCGTQSMLTVFLWNTILKRTLNLESCGFEAQLCHLLDCVTKKVSYLQHESSFVEHST